MTLPKYVFEEGHIFLGPDGQGYILTRNVTNEDVPEHSDFKPFGGAPQPVKYELIPEWLAEQIFKE